jgi:hypothetical protein
MIDMTSINPALAVLCADQSTLQSGLTTAPSDWLSALAAVTTANEALVAKQLALDTAEATKAAKQQARRCRRSRHRVRPMTEPPLAGARRIQPAGVGPGAHRGAAQWRSADLGDRRRRTRAAPLRCGSRGALETALAGQRRR